MPRPQTGQFREPGSSLSQFIPALTEQDLAGQLDQLARNARDRQSDNASRALEALSGTDPLLFPISSVVRPSMMAMLRRHETELARVQADPGRRYLNDEGLRRQDAE